MENRVDEGKIMGAKEIAPLSQTNKEKFGKCICKLNGSKGIIGTGFFCKIKYENSLIPVLITNYHVIDDNYIETNKIIKLYINDDSLIINIGKNSKIYSSIRDKYDMMVIRLKENDEINNFLEIDQNIFKNNSEVSYKNEQIYILHYPDGDKASISYGNRFEKINDFDFKHLCNTEIGSSGGPILSAINQ